jgi:hypothetical protein
VVEEDSEEIEAVAEAEEEEEEVVSEIEVVEVVVTEEAVEDEEEEALLPTVDGELAQSRLAQPSLALERRSHSIKPILRSSITLLIYALAPDYFTPKNSTLLFFFLILSPSRPTEYGHTIHPIIYPYSFHSQDHKTIDPRVISLSISATSRSTIYCLCVL